MLQHQLIMPESLITGSQSPAICCRCLGELPYRAARSKALLQHQRVETEFIAASRAVKEAAWLKGFLKKSLQQACRGWSASSKWELYCDHQGFIANLKNPINSTYT